MFTCSGAGTLAFFGNFRTFETISVSRYTAAEARIADLVFAGGSTPSVNTDQLDPQLVAERIVPEKDLDSTIKFKLLQAQRRPSHSVQDGPSSTGAPPSESAYDIEFVVESCRGEIQEAKGGRLRCVGPLDSDVDTTSRHSFMTAIIKDKYVYVAKGSSEAAKWESLARTVTAAVQSMSADMSRNS